jgi:hypothetical protein
MTQTDTTDAAKGTLRWYAESEEVAEKYKPKFQSIIEAFNNDKVIKITTSSILDGSSDAAYLCETNDRTYLYGTVTEGDFHVTEFDSIKDHPNIRLLLMMGASISSICLAESPLYDSGLDEIKKPDGKIEKGQ